MNRPTRIIGCFAVVSVFLAALGCGENNSSDADGAAAFLDSTIVVSGQGVSFASSRQTLQLFHLGPQISLTGDTVYSDFYLVSLACSVKVVSQAFTSVPEGGALNSSLLKTSMRTDRQVLDSVPLASQSGADAGWVYRVAPEAGKTGIAGKVILAARNNRGYMVSIGVVPDSLASWQSRIDAITAGVRFE